MFHLRFLIVLEGSYNIRFLKRTVLVLDDDWLNPFDDIVYPQIQHYINALKMRDGQLHTDLFKVAWQPF